MSRKKNNGIRIDETNKKSGLVVKSTGGLYSVEDSDGNITKCRAKGSFRHEHISPLAGDRVEFVLQDDGSGFIININERKNSLIRPAAANIDVLVIVSAVSDPEPDLFVLDKLSAVASHNDIDVLFVFNKSDIKSADELCKIYTDAGFCTVAISTKEKDAFEEQLAFLHSKLDGKINFFTGSSGVGKSSLINALFPSLSLETGVLSEKIKRGKHTTRVTNLYKVSDNTYIGDTPGFSSLDIAGFGMFMCDELLGAFPDIEKYATGCKYKKCTHLCEDGCRVVEAVEKGEIPKTRHESFVKLYNELKEIKPWDK